MINLLQKVYYINILRKYVETLFSVKRMYVIHGKVFMNLQVLLLDILKNIVGSLSITNYCFN